MDAASDDRRLEGLLAELSHLRRLAAALLRGPAAADVDDVVQDASVAALSSDVPRGGALGPWMRGVVRHLALSNLRGRSRRERRERIAASPDAQPGAADVARRIELHQAVLRAIAELPEPSRSAISRRYLDGTPPRAIARADGVPVATVKTRLQRGLAALRVQLGAQFGSELGAVLLALMRPVAAPVVPAAPVAGPVAIPVGVGAGASGVVAGTLGVVAMSAKSKLVLAAAGIAIAALVAPVAWRWSFGAKETSPTRALPAAAVVDGSGVDAAPAAEFAASRTPIPVTAAAAPRTAPRSRRERLGDERVAALGGRVVDEAGAPVAGAAVEIVRSGREEFAPARAAGAPELAAERRNAIADADGRFRFDDLVRGTAFSVRTRVADGRRGRFDRACAGRDDVAVTLFPTATVSGVVVDARDGQPVAGASVRPWGAARDVVATTGPDGRFELGGLELLGNGTSFVANVPDGRSSPPQFVEVRRGERAETKLRVGPADSAAAIEGLVVDAESGAPISGAAIRGQFPGLGLDVSSGADGAFRLAPGSGAGEPIGVEVAAPGYAPRRVALPPAADPPPHVVAKLRRGVRATGRVVAVDGTPLAGALIAAREIGPGAKERFVVAASDADGCFELAGLAPHERRHVLLVRHDECELTALPFPREPDASGAVDLGELRLGRGALVRGRVVDDTGAPVANAVVGVVGLEEEDGRSLEDFFETGNRVDCDGAGRFDLVGVPAGRWRLRASASGFVADAEATVTVDGPDFAGEATIVYARGRTITGRVVDERGRPLAGQTVWVKPPDDERASAHGPSRGFTTVATDVNGRFRAAGLPPGDWQLHVSAWAAPDGRLYRERTLERVAPGTEELEIVLEDGALITGHIRDAGGTPRTLVNVVALDSTGAIVVSGHTGSAGSFRLVVPPDLELKLEVRPPAADNPFSPAGRSVALTIDSVFGGDEPLEITLPAPPAPPPASSSDR